MAVDQRPASAGRLHRHQQLARPAQAGPHRPWHAHPDPRCRCHGPGGGVGRDRQPARHAGGVAAPGDRPAVGPGKGTAARPGALYPGRLGGAPHGELLRRGRNRRPAVHRRPDARAGRLHQLGRGKHRTQRLGAPVPRRRARGRERQSGPAGGRCHQEASRRGPPRENRHITRRTYAQAGNRPDRPRRRVGRDQQRV